MQLSTRLEKADGYSILRKLATKAEQKFDAAAVAIQERPDPSALDLTFLARQLVSCALPHSNPALLTRGNSGHSLPLGFPPKAPSA